MTLAEVPTTEQWIADTEAALLKLAMCKAVAEELASINPEADALFAELNELAVEPQSHAKATRQHRRFRRTARFHVTSLRRKIEDNDAADQIAAALTGEEI